MGCPEKDELGELKTLVKEFVPYAQKRMGFSTTPRVLFRIDSENC